MGVSQKEAPVYKGSKVMIDCMRIPLGNLQALQKFKKNRVAGSGLRGLDLS